MDSQTYIGVIGGREASDFQRKLAREMGKLIAREGWLLVCGGMGGIMEEASRGAREEHGVAIGILPGDRREEGNPFLTYSVVTGLRENRNSIVVRSCDGIFAIGGSYGTLSEISFAHLYNVPVVGLVSWKATPPGDPEESLVAFETEDCGEGVKKMKELLTSRSRRFQQRTR